MSYFRKKMKKSFQSIDFTNKTFSADLTSRLNTRNTNNDELIKKVAGMNNTIINEAQREKNLTQLVNKARHGTQALQKAMQSATSDLESAFGSILPIPEVDK